MSIPEITLSGSAEQRGLIHGESVRGLIESAIEAWFAHVSELIDPRELVAGVATSALCRVAESHAPALMQELAGIAKGAAQPFETIFAWQLIDETWSHIDDHLGGLRPVEFCSALAVNHSGEGIVAQTQDLPRHFHGHQVMLRYLEEDGMEVLVPSIAGLLALNGVNSAGLAVCITTLSQLPHSKDGLSSGLLMPGLLRCATVDDALALLRSTPAASGNSFTIGARDRSVVVEVSAAGTVIVDDGNVTTHTNHVLKAEPKWEYSGLDGSRARIDHLRSSVTPTVSAEEVAAVLSTPPVCASLSSDSAFVTIGTMIYELGDTQHCRFAPGPLDSVDLVAYEMGGSRA